MQNALVNLASPSRRAARSVGAVVVVLTVSAALPGCVKPLFPTGSVRTQFETYDVVRNQHEPDFFYDEYGRRTPNLRGRLRTNK
jgi:hypothetical protein